MLYIPKIKVDQTSQSIYFFKKKNHPETEKISSFNMSKFECAYYSINAMVFFVPIPYESYSTIKHIFKLVYYIYLF